MVRFSYICIVCLLIVVMSVILAIRLLRKPAIITGVLKSHIVLRDVIDVETRKKLLQEAETMEWSTARHANYPTTDVTVASIWWLDVVMLHKLKNIIMPQIASMYGVKFDDLWVRDMFFVKYHMQGQRMLNMHRDASTFSFVIQVNDTSNFEGGGTYIQKYDTTYRIDAGECLIFKGSELHAGVSITAGTRYIITGFIDHHPHTLDLRRQYLLYNLHYMAKRKRFKDARFHLKPARKV